MLLICNKVYKKCRWQLVVFVIICRRQEQIFFSEKCGQNQNIKIVLNVRIDYEYEWPDSHREIGIKSFLVQN